MAPNRWPDGGSRLKEASRGPFTANDFWTWDASLLAAVLCAQAPSVPSTSAKAWIIAGVARDVEEALGNTPAVCRKSYIDPRIFDRFEHGETIDLGHSEFRDQLDDLNQSIRGRIDLAVLDLLDDGASRDAKVGMA